MPTPIRQYPLVIVISALLCGGALAAYVPDDFREAQSALALGDIVRGEELLLLAVAAEPDFGPARYELGLLRHFARHDTEGGRENLIAALALGLDPESAARARFVLADIAEREWGQLASAGGPPAAIEAYLVRWPGVDRTAEARLLLASLLTGELERVPGRKRAEDLLLRFVDLPGISRRIGLVLLRIRFADLVREKDAAKLAALAREAVGTELEEEAAWAAFAARVWEALRADDATALRSLLADPRSEPHRVAIKTRLGELSPPDQPVPTLVPPAPPAVGVLAAEPAAPPAPPAVAAVGVSAKELAAPPSPPAAAELEVFPAAPTELVVPVAGATLALAVGDAEIRGAGLLKAQTVYRPRVTLLVGNRGDSPVSGMTVRGILTQGRGRVVEVREADVPGPFDPPLLPGEEPRALELLFSKGAGAGHDGGVSFLVALELSPDQGGRWVPAGSVALAGSPVGAAGIEVKVTLRPTPPEAVP